MCFDVHSFSMPFSAHLISHYMILVIGCSEGESDTAVLLECASDELKGLLCLVWLVI